MVTKCKPCARRLGYAEAALAQRYAALDQLRAVLGLFNRKEHMHPKGQAVIAEADALMAESERW